MDRIDAGIESSRKHIDLRVEDVAQTYPVIKALASEIRLRILAKLSNFSMNVNEIAEALHIPLSTAALNIKVLEDAGLLVTELQPGVRGAMKLCAAYYDSLSLRMRCNEAKREGGASVFAMQLPVGCFSACSVRPTCGMVSENSALAAFDIPSAFYVPERFQAQMLWFNTGYVSYDFSSMEAYDVALDWIEVSFEVCSEASNYRNNWKSDISVWINGIHLGFWTSPGDFGGRRGLLNPPWWPDTCTQYGHLKTWRVDESGTFLDGEWISPVRLSDLRLGEGDTINLRIGVAENAANQGGVNLFGEKFGDHAQHIMLRLAHRA